MLIAVGVHALPLMHALHRALLERDAWPLLRVAPDELAEGFYRHARATHLDSFPPLDRPRRRPPTR